MAVVWVKGNTVVAIPTVEDSILSAAGYGTCLMEWALGVVSFGQNFMLAHISIYG